jgi:hypothetical protein
MLINLGRFFYFRCCIGITKDISWLHILFLQGPFHIVNEWPATYFAVSSIQWPA